jgi:hypothetical protein
LPNLGNQRAESRPVGTGDFGVAGADAGQVQTGRTRRAYEAAWTVGCGLLAVVGAGVVFVFSPVVLLVLAVCFGFVGGVLTLTLTEAGWEQTRLGRVRVFARGALLGALAAGGFVGHVVLLGPGVFLLTLVVVAASPTFARRYAGWLGRARGAAPSLDEVAGALAYASPELVALHVPSSPVTAFSPDPEPDPEVEALTDEQLCRQWRASYTAVVTAGTAAEMERLAARRQHLLDELDRRHRLGFTAWLASSPRSAGNPLPYLQGRRAARCGIDWDELITGQDR